jgi:LPS O-antigen subunit length determinant protein (WzzB/FepE family)
MEKQKSSTDAAIESIKIIKDDEFDLVALLKVIWLARKKIFVSVVFCVVIGLFYAFLSPVTYRSNAVILPQSEGKSNLGQLGSLASLAGVNLSNVMNDNEGIQPEVYPSIVRSFPFLNELIHTPLNYEGEKMPISFYKKEMDGTSKLGSAILKYTIYLPWTFKNVIMGNKIVEPVLSSDNSELVALNIYEQRIFNKLSGRVSVSEDKKTGLVSIVAEMDEPLVAAQIAQKTLELLQIYVIKYKTSLVQENLMFIEARFNERKEEFEKAQIELFQFRDSYRNLVAERIDTRYQELQDNYNISMSVYQGLSQQLEQARIAVKKETPVFSIIEPVKVPILKHKPKRTSILIISGFIGVFVGLSWLFGILAWVRFKNAWNGNGSDA